MRILLTALVALFPALPWAEPHADDEQACKAIKQKIRRVESKMRAGYTRAQGERLAAELHRLRKLRAERCR